VDKSAIPRSDEVARVEGRVIAVDLVPQATPPLTTLGRSVKDNDRTDQSVRFWPENEHG
jgi:hypothetical protein